VRKSVIRSSRALAIGVAASVVGVSTVVLLSTASPPATAAAAPGATERVSVPDARRAPPGPAGRGHQQELSADGTAVAFTSREQLDDLGTGKGYQNVYVRDLAHDRTVLVSRGQLTRPGPVPGEVPPDQSSYQPTISVDGRYVAFVTTASNIVAEDADHDQDVIVCDRDPDGDQTFDEDKADGERDYRYFRVSQPVYTGGEFPVRVDNPSWPKLSDSAARIVWQDEVPVDGQPHASRVKSASLVPQPGGPVTSPAGVEVVAGELPGAQLRSQSRPDISGDGRFVVFAAEFTRPGAAAAVRFRPVVRTETGTHHTVRVDLNEDLTPIATGDEVTAYGPAISGDGAEIAFTAEGRAGLLPSRQPNVYVVRLNLAAKPVDSVLVSRGNDGTPVNGSSPALSGDGRFVAFVSDSRAAHDGADTAGARTCLRAETDSIAGEPAMDIAGIPPLDEKRADTVTCQVVVRDLAADRDADPRLPGTLASPARGDCGCGGNGNSTPYRDVPAPALSRDGSRVAYDSDAPDLVEGDGNSSTDVFVRTFRPELRADPLDFGDVLVDTSFAATATVTHVGLGPLTVAEIEVAGDDAGDFAAGDTTCAPNVLQQTGSCLVEVLFTPSAEGGRSAVLRLVLADKREYTVDLRGAGTTAPQPGAARFAAGPDPVDFGERLPLSNGPATTVTVTNGGESALEVSAVGVAAPGAGFAVAAESCTAGPLPAGGTCTVSVRFSPSAPGDLAAVLRFDDSAPGAPHLVGLRGAGAKPAIVVSPGVTPPGRVVTVSGTGFAPGRPIVTTMDGARQTGPVFAAADGTFRASLLVLWEAPIGNFTVVAKVADSPALNAAKPLLVVTPTVSPADFVVRG
jgi:hypothetical protein